jgi:hypothetical protein
MRNNRTRLRAINNFRRINMKASPTYIITCFVILLFVMISLAIQHHFRKQSLEINNKQIMFYTGALEDFKKELKNTPDEAVTKADLAAFTDRINYQNSTKGNKAKEIKGSGTIFYCWCKRN